MTEPMILRVRLAAPIQAVRHALTDAASLRVWLAEHQGAVLPPISVVEVGDERYAVRDGHHRVSVARARGAISIDATVDAA